MEYNTAFTRKVARMLVLAFVLIAAFLSSAAVRQGPSLAPLRFRITLAKGVAPGGAGGRLLVFMSDSNKDQQTLGINLLPGSMRVAALEVEHIGPEQAIDFDPDVKAFPGAFSKAAPGTYQFMALLDTRHSYTYNGQGEGHIYGPVVKIENLNPASTTPIDLTLDKQTDARFKPSETEGIKPVDFQSPLLTAFWGRAIFMRAAVVLPPGYGKNSEQRYPAVYHVHGFGGNRTDAWRAGPPLIQKMTDGKYMEMIHVFLDGSFPTGHHEFADSVNNGPWGRALTEEFIPYLEKQFRLVAKPYARFLTGHSSGGWSTLWLQITYPDFFGGTWSTSPDPVDLRSFSGINVTPGSTDNAYHTNDGKPRNIVRMNGKDVIALEQYSRMEDVLGEYGGQFASFEWVWSPKGEDGRPAKLFNRETGSLNQDVLRAWQRYDIRLILENDWERLGPKLRGKITVICGAADTFHRKKQRYCFATSSRARRAMRCAR